ncbi:hypothetical protein HDU76_001354 [Blyttiomyces sp. JEL0837]|nr:hypothetical protein HDU76_001354 [Blyttiomyces sp. JEL0837]
MLIWTSLSVVTGVVLSHADLTCPPLLFPISLNMTTTTTANITSPLNNETNSFLSTITSNQSLMCVNPPGNFMISLVIIEAVIAFLFLVSLGMDYKSYMKGVYWDLEDFREREQAATMSTIRQLNKYSNRLQQGQVGEMSCSRSRHGSVTLSRSGSFGNLLKKSDSVKGGLASLQGTVAGKDGDKSVGAKVVSREEREGIKKSASGQNLSSFMGPACLPRVDAINTKNSALAKSVNSLAGSRNNSSSNLAAMAGGGSGGNSAGTSNTGLNAGGGRVRSGSTASLLSKGGASAKKRLG